MSRNLIIAILAVVFVGAAGAVWVLTRPAETPEVTQIETPDAPAEIDETLPDVIEMSLGNPDADVTVIEYASFTCPHCRNFHENVFGKLKADYIDTGKINFIYREVYFDKFGLWAGMIARCSGPIRYFGITDMIYEQQSEWLATRTDAGIAADLRKLGLQAGIDADQLDACLADSEMAQALVAEFQKNAAADDVSSTPTFIINGTKYTNMSYDDFAGILNKELGE